MRLRRHGLILLLTALGISVCLVGVLGFVWAIFSNNLPWEPNKSPRAYYREIGDAFGDGFVLGFFLCFFLVLGMTKLNALFGTEGREVPDRVPAQPVRRRFRVIRGRGP
jgi:hypothetical protein